MKFSFILLLALFCSLGHTAYSQSEEGEKAVGTVYLGTTYSTPVGNYRQAYAHADALGGTFGLLLNPLTRPTALELGLQVSYLSQGVEKDRSTYSTSYPILKTAHSLVPLHAVARVKPMKEMRIKPYLDGLAGITVFNTRTKLKEDLFDFMMEDHQAVILDKYRTTVISYGIGAGILFRGNKSKSSYADLRITYFQSPFANYVKKGHVSVQQDGFPVYQFTRSETSMLTISLNVSGVLTR